MNPISSLKFTLRHSDGRTEQLAVDASRALVGSGAHCEIRLPADECPVEQLVVEARSGGVFAEARSMDPPALVNGLPFTQGRLLPESILSIGGLELSVSSAELVSREVSTKKQNKSKTSPITYLAAVIGFPLGIYTLFVLGPEKEGGAPPRPPALWSEKRAQTCSESERSRAQAVATQELVRANAKHERSPFSAEDGVAAVGLYERAAACFAVAGNEPTAGDARRRAAELKESLSRQFHVHQVRLERSLATKDYDATLREVRILLGFLRHRSGAYTSWLGSLERRIELKFAGKKK